MRIAVLVPWFGTPRRSSVTQTRIFPYGWGTEASEFAPQALVGTRNQLFELTQHPPSSLTHALIALSRTAETILSDTDRDLLWAIFGVPIFDQVIGRNGELLATECETHQGLHIESPDYAIRGQKILTGNFANSSSDTFDGLRLEHDVCPCGRPSPRLMPMRMRMLDSAKDIPRTKQLAAGAGSAD